MQTKQDEEAYAGWPGRSKMIFCRLCCDIVGIEDSFTQMIRDSEEEEEMCHVSVCSGLHTTPVLVWSCT